MMQLLSRIFRFLQYYPFSLGIILIVTYLSFFRPPSPEELPMFPGMDKLIHFLMYFGMSGMLWLEFKKAHRKDCAPLWHVWVGGLLCPILFSGAVEILQEYCTSYRGGDWLDFVANASGAIVASLIGRKLLS